MKILVYVDPSFRGEWALAPAADLARSLCGTVILLATEESLRAQSDLLQRAAARFSGTPGLVVETRVRPGPAREVILQESRASAPAIIIFPPAGRHGLGRMLHGSRVKAVVHDSPSTVMVAKKPVSEHIHRILVTVSGGPFSETTLLSAKEIAAGLRAELGVLHVASAVRIPFSNVEEGESAPPEHGNLELHELLARLGLQEHLRLREGMVVHEILEECHDGQFDLLVLGQHLAEADAGGPLTENIAEILAMECPIPLLIVRPRRSSGERGKAPASGAARGE